MGIGAALKALVICQPEEVSILPGKDGIPRLDCLPLRYPDGRWANQGHT